MVPAGRRLSRVDSKTLRESFTGQDNAEMEAVMRNLARKDDKIKYNRRMRVVLAAAVGVMVIMVGAMFAVTLSANEATKESHVKNNALVGLNGLPVKTETYQSYAKLFDLPKFDIATLAQVKHLTVQTHDQLEVSMEITKATKQAGSAVAKFFTATGDVVTIDGESHVVLATIDNKCHTIDVTKGDAGMARKLSDAAAPRLYSTEEFFALPDFEGFQTTHRKLNKDSKMAGFAAVALSASEAVLDVLEANTAVDTSFGFSGKAMDTTQCADVAEFTVWTSKDRKENKIVAVNGDKRTITHFVDGEQGIEFSYAKSETSTGGWKLSQCRHVQFAQGENKQVDEVNKIKGAIVSHRGNEFLLKYEHFYVQGRTSFGANADKLVESPDPKECDKLLAKDEAKDPDDSVNPNRRLGDGRRQLLKANTELWWASQCSYVAKCTDIPSSRVCQTSNSIAKTFTIGGKSVVAFAGTDGVNDFGDWLDNLDIRKEGVFHKGFHRYQNNIASCVNSKAPSGGWDYCVGHSLGGASVTVYARVHGKCKKTVTFGAPKSIANGNRNCNAKGTRYYHRGDPITSDGTFLIRVLSGFQHDVSTAREVWEQEGTCYCGSYLWGCGRSGYWVSCGWRGCRDGYHCNNSGRRPNQKRVVARGCSTEGDNQNIVSALVKFISTVHTQYHKFVPDEQA